MIEVADKLKPKNGNTFKIIDINDIDYDGLSANIRIKQLIEESQKQDIELAGYATEEYVTNSILESVENMTSIINKKISNPPQGVEGQVLTIDENLNIVWKTPEKVDTEKIINIKEFPIANQENKIVFVQMSGITESGVYVIPKTDNGLIPLGVNFIWTSQDNQIVKEVFVENGACDVYSVLINVDGIGTCILSNGIDYFKYRISETVDTSFVELKANVLKTNNNIPYEPEDDYNPATVKFVKETVLGNNLDLSKYTKEEDVKNIVISQISELKLQEQINTKLSIPENDPAEGYILEYNSEGKVVWSNIRGFITESISEIIGNASEDYNTFEKIETIIKNNIEAINTINEALNTINETLDTVTESIDTINETLDTKLDKPIIDGKEDQILVMGADGKAIWEDKYIVNLDPYAQTSYVDDEIRKTNQRINTKMEMPIQAGTVGQVLTINSDGDTVWSNPTGGSSTTDSIVTSEDIDSLFN